jgi:hypothetical protein
LLAQYFGNSEFTKLRHATPQRTQRFNNLDVALVAALRDTVKNILLKNKKRLLAWLPRSASDSVISILLINER